MLPIDRTFRPSIVSELMALRYTSILVIMISVWSLKVTHCERCSDGSSTTSKSEHSVEVSQSECVSSATY